MQSDESSMAFRLNQVQGLLQSLALPADLADNPERTAQWLAVLRSLQQALALLQGGEARAMRVFSRFQRLTEGLPEACLMAMPATAKFDLLQKMLSDLEARFAGLDLSGMDTGPLHNRLRQCHRALCAMAARLQPPSETREALAQPV